jgi:hypothetical protein
VVFGVSMDVCLIDRHFYYLFARTFSKYIISGVKTCRKMMTLKLVLFKKPKNKVLTELMESPSTRSHKINPNQRILL